MEANHPAAPPAPPCHPPAKGEAAELVDWLQSMRELAGEHNPEEQRRYDRAAALLQQQQAEIKSLTAQQTPVQVGLPAEEVATIADRLKELACAVTKERWSEFCMRVPAQPLRDADLVISRAAKLLQQQQVEIEQLKQQLETERMSLAVCNTPLP